MRNLPWVNGRTREETPVSWRSAPRFRAPPRPLRRAQAVDAAHARACHVLDAKTSFVAVVEPRAAQGVSRRVPVAAGRDGPHVDHRRPGPERCGAVRSRFERCFARSIRAVGRVLRNCLQRPGHHLDNLVVADLTGSAGSWLVVEALKEAAPQVPTVSRDTPSFSAIAVLLSPSVARVGGLAAGRSLPPYCRHFSTKNNGNMAGIGESMTRPGRLGVMTGERVLR